MGRWGGGRACPGGVGGGGVAWRGERRGRPRGSLARRGYRGGNGWRRGQRARALRGFIYHSPNYTLLPFEGRSVVTVHDLSFLRYPEFHPAERIAFLAREFPKALARADQVITDSAYVADEIRARLGVPRERLSVVALGVDPVVRPLPADPCQFGRLHPHSTGIAGLSGAQGRGGSGRPAATVSDLSPAGPRAAPLASCAEPRCSLHIGPLVAPLYRCLRERAPLAPAAAPLRSAQPPAQLPPPPELSRCTEALTSPATARVLCCVS